jgi:hypothetical protein
LGFTTTEKAFPINSTDFCQYWSVKVDVLENVFRRWLLRAATLINVFSPWLAGLVVQ